MSRPPDHRPLKGLTAQPHVKLSSLPEDGYSSGSRGVPMSGACRWSEDPPRA